MSTSMYYRNSLKLKLTLMTRIILLLGAKKSIIVLRCKVYEVEMVVECNRKSGLILISIDLVPSELIHPRGLMTTDHMLVLVFNQDDTAAKTFIQIKPHSILKDIVMWEVHQGGHKIHTVIEQRPVDGGRVRVFTNHYGETLLEINKVRETDAGRYICKTGAAGNMAINAEIELIVNFAPKLPWTTINRTLHEGETDELWCNATGIPIPIIEWFRKSRVNDTQYERIGISGNMLRIHKITRYARDIYMCHASNEFGSVNGFINVDVFFPAELGVFEKELQRLNKDTGVEMACAVTANPMVNIVWYKGDKEEPIQAISWKYELRTEDDMKEDYYTTFSILTILSTLDQADFDTYYCKVQNDSGHFIASEAINLVRRPEE